MPNSIQQSESKILFPMEPIDKISDAMSAAYHRGLTDGEKKGSERTRTEGYDSGYKVGYERGYDNGLATVLGHPNFWVSCLIVAGVFTILGMILRGVVFPC